jgi:2,3-bisphosphoglycerate-independent phosphoglycerate mutase
MESNSTKNERPVALVILDGWGYAPRTEGNAIAIAHTPYYDEICRTYPMALLSACKDDDIGDAEVGHLRMGTGRTAQTDVARIADAVASGTFLKNEVLNAAFNKAGSTGASVHFIGLVSDGGVHSSKENLFALLRLAKRHGLKDVFVHCILDGLDVAPRTADVYVEALEVKMNDIGAGRIATLCGRFFAMDASENWERTARAYTMLVHAEGERAADALPAIRNSFLRGISDEFISPIIIEREAGVPVTTLNDGDLVVFFNHRADAMIQLVRSVSVPDGAGSKPMVDTICLTEYDAAFDLAAAYKTEPEKNALSKMLSDAEIVNYKITETERVRHLTHFFDGGADLQSSEEQIFVPNLKDGPRYGQPESESFRIVDKFLRGLESTSNGVFVVNMPGADLAAASGDISKTVAAIQFIDTCLGGICEGIRSRDGVVMVTSTHGNCEEMFDSVTGETRPSATANPVPFHYVDAGAGMTELRDNGSLEDIAPTILSVLGIEKPQEMTGSDLRML